MSQVLLQEDTSQVLLQDETSQGLQQEDASQGLLQEDTMLENISLRLLLGDMSQGPSMKQTRLVTRHKKHFQIK